MHTVSVRNIEFQGRHGAYAAERETLRRFQVDVDLHAVLDKAAASDRLEDTIDYYAVCALVEDIGRTHTYHLLEALVSSIAAALAQRWPYAELEVEVRKLNPPCPGNPSYTAVRLIRPSSDP